MSEARGGTRPGGDARTRGRRAFARTAALTVAGVVAAATLAGCGIRIPTDPDGTLDRVTGGELRVGASASGELVVVDGTDVSGTLAELMEGFAAERDAKITWT